MEPEKVSVAAHYRLPWLLTSFAKFLDFCSKGLATRFLWRIFCGPIKFKTPSREAEFYKKTEQEKDTGEIYKEGNHVLSDSKRRQKAALCAWLEWEMANFSG